jgi:hypothetical protein
MIASKLGRASQMMKHMWSCREDDLGGGRSGATDIGCGRPETSWSTGAGLDDADP